MTEAIIEAAARAYCRVANIPQDRWHVATERIEAVLAAVAPLIEAAVLAAVAPLIRADALEEAAKVAEGYPIYAAPEASRNIAAAIRALKDKS